MPIGRSRLELPPAGFASWPERIGTGSTRSCGQADQLEPAQAAACRPSPGREISDGRTGPRRSAGSSTRPANRANSLCVQGIRLGDRLQASICHGQQMGRPYPHSGLTFREILMPLIDCGNAPDRAGNVI